MENTYKIIVDVNANVSGGLGGAEPQSVSVIGAQENNQKKLKTGKTASKIAIIHLAKQAAQYGVSNYGNFTGDYVGQAKLNEGIQIATYGAALATGLGGVLYVATDLTLMAISQSSDIRKANQEAAQLRERTGMSTSGGR